MTIANLLKFILAFVVLGSIANAQTPKSSKKSRLRGYLSKSFIQTSTDITFWQENIDITSPTASGTLPSFFQGLRFQASLLKPRQSNPRWVYSYSGAVAIGGVKGTATGGLSDEFSQQKWLMVGVAPGIIYRTSTRTEIGFRVPLDYRLIFWEINPGSDVEVSRGNSFSYGLSGVFITRYTLRSAIAITLTHHHVWQASIWSIGWQ